MIHRMELGDVLIRRARNGWVVISAVDETIDGEAQAVVLDTFVYADDEHSHSEVASAHALLSAIREHFDGQFRSKHRGGILALVREQGRETDDHEPNPEGEGE